MVSERSQHFRSRFGQVLVENGLLSRARRWYRDGEELVSIVDLQGSQFGDFFYVNLGPRAAARAKRNPGSIELRELVTSGGERLLMSCLVEKRSVA
jgi:hypothetical protein